MKGKMNKLYVVFDQYNKTIKIAAALILIIAAVLFYGIKENNSTITLVNSDGGRIKTPSAATDTTNRTRTQESGNKSGKVFVDIGGEVRKPGVYSVSKSARIYEVVNKAGGLTSKAETSTINQAETVTDGQKITIPSKNTQPAPGNASSAQNAGQSGSSGAPAGTSATAGTDSDSGSGTGTDISGSSSGVAADSSGSASSSELININTADSTTLQQISGVGPVTAEKIIEYRTQNGAFKSAEDIKNVSGIGDKTYEKMKDHITV